MNILISGVAGFIGMHMVKAYEGHTIVGVDNLNPYYDLKLKEKRLEVIKTQPDFTFIKADVCDEASMENIFNSMSFDVVIHLAAQAGVRYSKKYPLEVFQSNTQGFMVIATLAQRFHVKTMVYASSSSVYGHLSEGPFQETMKVDQPSSVYALSKRVNELCAQTLSHQGMTKFIGCRFFSVIGPYGRPDMAYFKFSHLASLNQPITIYGDGSMKRDFTSVFDVCAMIQRLVEQSPSFEPHTIVNLGATHPVSVAHLIEQLESFLQMKMTKQYEEASSIEVPLTHADVSYCTSLIGEITLTPFEESLASFITWFKEDKPYAYLDPFID
ncbi:MAG: NAD-dependent epimerase/dehydratase family protein [Erysipelothrix sp.]|jgi:UDP-glucuronate 4-epimerase|nr:NAD-dependent epimerase/dehydratase family protein [Erysipelothrix sp.]